MEMKVVAINGSPRGRDGNTQRILEPFLEGTRDAGADVETIYLKDKKINHCLGCFSCWVKTPGVCVHHDDMPEILEKVFAADMLVYATPLYCYSVTGMMKDFLDRNIPLLTPAIQLQDGRYCHDPRRERKIARKRVLISTCGFPGADNFSGLLETFKIMTREGLNAAILCSQGGALGNQDLQEQLQPYFGAVKKAGGEVVELGYIETETQSLLEQEFLDPQKYQHMANARWQTAMGGPSR